LPAKVDLLSHYEPCDIFVWPRKRERFLVSKTNQNLLF
jgi:hypothetical protein